MAQKKKTEQSPEKTPGKTSGCPGKSPGNTDETKKSSNLFDVILYILAFSLICFYGLFAYDKNAFISYSKSFTPLQPLANIFEKIEQFSPFIEFLEDENWAKETTENNDIPYESTEKILTRDELKKYDGSEGSLGLYIAILGQVFDVSKSPQYYGPNGGYGFFAGKDASRAFVTGQFDEEGLIDDVSGEKF